MSVTKNIPDDMKQQFENFILHAKNEMETRWQERNKLRKENYNHVKKLVEDFLELYERILFYSDENRHWFLEEQTNCNRLRLGLSMLLLLENMVKFQELRLKIEYLKEHSPDKLKFFNIPKNMFLNKKQFIHLSNGIYNGKFMRTDYLNLIEKRL